MEEKTVKNNSRRKKIIIASSVVASLLFLFLIAPYSVSAIVYNVIFGGRITTREYLRYYVEDFDGLQAERYEFKSNENQTLTGYRYSLADSTPQGVVVISHGFGGGGQNGYMGVAYYFTQNGYDVFAYDATGNDESGGKGVGGLPQGVIDLHYALEYIKEIDTLKSLPVMLWGHSWGGYSVCSALTWHSEVKAVASIAGFNNSSDLIEANGVKYGGEISKTLLPYVNSVERIKFKNYAGATAIKGFTNSNAGVFIAHSADDKTVPIKYGYDKYYKKFSKNSRFTFVRYEDKGHTDILYSQERIDYMKEFYAKEKEFFGGRKVTDKQRAAYAKENLNRSIFCKGLNEQLFCQIVEFYNSYL